MNFNKQQEHVYVMSINKVSKVKVQECDLYETCEDCSIGARDPYCGWCTLENRCSTRARCNNANATNRWISVSSRECVRFMEIIPSQIPVGNANTVELRVNRLPALLPGYGYSCVFGTAAPSPAKTPRNSAGLICDTPPMQELAMFAGDGDHFSVPLYIRSTETSVDFVSHMFTFYNCSVHATCSQCMLSRWACSWCMYSNRCTNNPTQCAIDNPGEGENLNLASDTGDVVVTVGLQPCNVTSLAETQLVCHPPPEQPPGVDDAGRERRKLLPIVTVSARVCKLNPGRGNIGQH
ncbi:PREDICTED: plexin-B-like [Priapulus caudatus]|uniref:Plexin-B-like n=1 Tax=Priapulus caudatus TaxID=37621 RepID=A0ABM1EHL5_PRICU|nr:PREDICTED: plexin-B-like [Priapulus caudatus]